MSTRLTTSEFISRAKAVHGDKYLYDKTNYISMYNKVTITCKIHGDFEQKAQSHINGFNCYFCYEEARNKRIIPKIKYTREEFIDMCEKKYNNIFDYSNIEYKNLSSVLKLYCEKHGEINISASAHLNNSFGCVLCSNEKQSQTQRIPILDIIKSFNDVHKFKYDYSLIDTQFNLTVGDKVPIICSIHGIFYQSIGVHKSGWGCQKCGKSNTGNLLKIYKNNADLGNQIGIFYILKFKHKTLNFEFIKIGITRKSIEYRYKSYHDYTYDILNVIYETNLNTAIIEYEYKNNKKLTKFIFPENLETFKGKTECYIFNEDNLKIFNLIKFRLYSTK